MTTSVQSCGKSPSWPTVRSAVSAEVSETTIIARQELRRSTNQQRVPRAHNEWESGAGRVRAESRPAKVRRLRRPIPAWIRRKHTRQWPGAMPWIAATGALRNLRAALAACTHVAASECWFSRADRLRTTFRSSRREEAPFRFRFTIGNRPAAALRTSGQ